jgi:hypothetical protein
MLYYVVGCTRIDIDSSSLTKLSGVTEKVNKSFHVPRAGTIINVHSGLSHFARRSIVRCWWQLGGKQSLKNKYLS